MPLSSTSSSWSRALGRSVFAALLFLTGCSSSKDESAPASTDAATEDAGVVDDASTDSGAGDAALACTFPVAKTTPLAGAACASGCELVKGSELDERKNCIHEVFVGCLSCSPPATCGGAPDIGCYKNRSDGRIVQLVSYAVLGSDAWVKCTKKESDKFAGLFRCLQ